MITKTVKLLGGDYSKIMDALQDCPSYVTNPMTEDVEVVVDNDVSNDIDGIPGADVPLPFVQENNGFTFTIKRAE